MKISLVVAIDLARGMGLNNQLLCHLPADLKHFKQLTWGKPIVMGRKTFESIGRPLPGRQNVVLSQHVSTIPGVDCVASLSAAWQLLKDAPEVMVIGGANIFEQTLPLATELYLTQIHHTFAADTFFPTFDELGFTLAQSEIHPADPNNPYGMTFYHYTRTLTTITGWDLFLDLCLSTSDKQALSQWFELLLTEEEKQSLSARILIIQALLSGEQTQREIAKQLNVSIAKITRGSNMLKRMPPTFLSQLQAHFA